MKRSLRLLASSAIGAATLFAASPAYAQYYDDAAGEGLAFGMLACYGVLLLVAIAFFIWWIILLVDLFKRQEWEFPNSTGSSKTLWMVVMLVGWAVGFSWLAAILYYFMVYKKGPKPGTMQAPSVQAPAAYAPPAAPPPPPAPAAAPAPPSYAPPAPPAPAAPPAPPVPAAAPPAPPAPPAPSAAPPAPPASPDQPADSE